MFAVVRTPQDEEYRVLCVINVSSEEVEFSISAEDAGLQPGVLTELTADRTIDATSGTIDLKLEPYDVWWLKG